LDDTGEAQYMKAQHLGLRHFVNKSAGEVSVGARSKSGKKKESAGTIAFRGEHCKRRTTKHWGTKKEKDPT